MSLSYLPCSTYVVLLKSELWCSDIPLQDVCRSTCLNSCITCWSYRISTHSYSKNIAIGLHKNWTKHCHLKLVHIVKAWRERSLYSCFGSDAVSRWGTGSKIDKWMLGNQLSKNLFKSLQKVFPCSGAWRMVRMYSVRLPLALDPSHWE